MANLKYDFEYDAEHVPNSREAKAEALENAGPLFVAPGHWAAYMLPDAFDKVTAAPKVKLTVHAMQYIFLPGAILSDAIKKAGMHWTMDPARCAKYMQALDASGFDTTPIKGSISIALPMLMRRVREHMIRELTAEQRKLDVDEVIFDSPLEEGGDTETWYDYMSSAMLMAGDSDATVVAHFKLIVIYSNCADDRASDYFKSGLKGVEAGIQNPAFSDMVPMTQAAIVAMHFRATRPPLHLDVYMPVENIALEAARRAIPEAAGRYLPLLEVGWRDAFPPISKLWPREVQNNDVCTNMSALAVALSVSPTGVLNDAIVSAL